MAGMCKKQNAMSQRHDDLRREPQPEVGVSVLWSKLFAQLLECGHPGHGEVDVLQEDPRAFLRSLLNHPQCDRSLALAERQRLQRLTIAANVRVFEHVSVNMKTSALELALEKRVCVSYGNNCT